jgi:hypothetical protein
MKKTIWAFSLVFISTFQIAKGQTEIDLAAFAERLFSVQDADVNYEDIYESLLLYYTNPIDLNKTDRDELAGLFILSPIQLNQFFDHRNSFGALLSINELQSIEGFDIATIQNLKPFVTVEEKADSRTLLQRMKEEENNFLLLRYGRNIEKEAGFNNQEMRYLGDANSLYSRYRISRSHDFSIGFTAEKDAGEPFTWSQANKVRGFDFYSFHFSLQDKGRIENITIGDYQIQYGQGLVLGAGFSAGKGAETVNTLKRNNIGIRPYGSALESGFFRGAATTLRKENSRLTLFYSKINQDASLNTDSAYSDYDEFANSIQTTGYHRLPSEITSKNSIKEQNFGLVYQYNVNSRFDIGAIILNTNYSVPIEKRPNNYNQFEFSGDNNLTSSVYSNYVWQNFIFFGECARSRSGGMGAIGGFMASLTPKIDFGVHFRNYQKDFHSFYGNAFGEGSRPINEKGTYWGIKLQPYRKHQIAAYYDQFRFPWLKYQVNAPSEGFEYLIRYTYTHSKSAKIFAQFRQEEKEQSDNTNQSNLSSLTSAKKSNYVIGVNFGSSKTLEFNTRVQGSNYNKAGANSYGYALIQDINFQLWKIKFSSRMAIFETDYANRQYSFEKNVLYAYSLPAYNGTGTRSYLMAQFNANPKTTIWIRWSQFNYPSQTTIGSGNSEISGSSKSSITIMARMKF